MLKRIFNFFSAVFAIIFIFSCSNGTEEPQDALSNDTVVNTIDTAALDGLTQFKYDNLISNVAIPFDILRLNTEVPLAYKAEAINPTSNLNYYISSTSKAMNLGIYGGDLAYSITYERFDDMGSYVKCAKKLAEDLGIPLAFDQSALSNYKKYGTNQDSLEKIVFNSYLEVDKTLKSNERIGLAALVVSGGWLEGLYATLTSLGTTPINEKSQNLYKKIWEQKNHLNMIISLLEQFKDDKSFTPIIEDFKAINNIYNGLSDKSSINEKEILILSQKVGEVRGKIISH